jgi:hypothetical protein
MNSSINAASVSNKDIFKLIDYYFCEGYFSNIPLAFPFMRLELAMTLARDYEIARDSGNPAI